MLKSLCCLLIFNIYTNMSLNAIHHLKFSQKIPDIPYSRLIIGLKS